MYFLFRGKIIKLPIREFVREKRIENSARSERRLSHFFPSNCLLIELASVYALPMILAEYEKKEKTKSRPIHSFTFYLRAAVRFRIRFWKIIATPKTTTNKTLPYYMVAFTFVIIYITRYIIHVASVMVAISIVLLCRVRLDARFLYSTSTKRLRVYSL